MYRARSKNIPNIPSSLDKVTIPPEWCLNNNKRFLLSHVVEDNVNLLIFCSDIGLELLSKSTRWHSDGTFKVAPSLFYQFNYEDRQKLTNSIITY